MSEFTKLPFLDLIEDVRFSATGVFYEVAKLAGVNLVFAPVSDIPDLSPAEYETFRSTLEATNKLHFGKDRFDSAFDAGTMAEYLTVLAEEEYVTFFEAENIDQCRMLVEKHLPEVQFPFDQIDLHADRMPYMVFAQNEDDQEAVLHAAEQANNDVSMLLYDSLEAAKGGMYDCFDQVSGPFAAGFELLEAAKDEADPASRRRAAYALSIGRRAAFLALDRICYDFMHSQSDWDFIRNATNYMYLLSFQKRAEALGIAPISKHAFRQHIRQQALPAVRSLGRHCAN